MTIIPNNFADTLLAPRAGAGRLPPLLAAVAPDLRRLYGEPADAAVPAQIAALLARLAGGEPGR